MLSKQKWLIIVVTCNVIYYCSIKSEDLEILENYKDAELKIKDTSQFLDEYDFVIIGGGSAGSVLANRLSEIHEWTVLLLEAGTDGDIYTEIPFFATHAQNTKYDWNYTTEKVEGACLGFDDEVCVWPRGKSLGGTSVLNYMQYTRGNKEDYDNWNKLGNTGWGYDDILKYFLKSEDMTIPDLKASKYHAAGGYLTIEGLNFKTILDQTFLDAGVERGYSINDFNGETQTGFYLSQSNTRKGRRCSSAKAFLHPVQNRKNLHISKDSFVTKIIIDSTSKVAHGVQFTKGGKLYTIYFRKEVILSAGAIASPQLLMASGIGPHEHLRDLGIQVIQDLKVGFNLQDHISFMQLSFKTPYAIFPEVHLSNENVVNFFENGKGPLTSCYGVSGFGFVNSEKNANTDVPDIELIALGFAADQNSFGIIPLLLHPKSKGRIMLRSVDVYQHPIIQPNYLAEIEDLHLLREGIKLVMDLVNTESFKKLNATLNLRHIPACEHLHFQSDEFWECCIRQFTSTVFHPVGTCKMGPSTDSEAVVDPELLVYGIKGLRVVDASIMPEIPGAHTNAPVYMIAEKAADMVKQKWRK